MYEMLKNYIKNGDFKLESVLVKIDNYYLWDRITQDQREELINLAREKADVRTEIDVPDMALSHEKRISELEKTVKTLTAEIKALKENKPVEPPEEVVEEYQVGKTYYRDNKIMWQGKKYICIAPEGAVCVWNPAGMPSYWKEIN